MHLLVWIAYSLNPNIDKPQKSVEQLLVKITPMLETITKSIIKPGTSDNISENMSSVSKGEKNISPHFRAVNKNLLDGLKGNSCRKNGQQDTTIKLRELLGYGIESGVLGEPEFALLERIIDKYLDSEILNRPRQSQWDGSSFSTKLLNILNYELIEYEFTEIVYFLIIKKLPTHKETEENKNKYQSFLDSILEAKPKVEARVEEEVEFANEPRFLQSSKDKKKKKLVEKRGEMERWRSEEVERQKRVEREELERQLMSCEDKDIQDEEFEEEESDL